MSTSKSPKSDDKAKKRKTMQVTRSTQNTYAKEQASNFRMLVVLNADNGLRFSVNTSDNDLIKQFYKFSTNEKTRKDFIATLLPGDDPSPLFEWEGTDCDSDNKTIADLCGGAIPLWSYLLGILLKTGNPTNNARIDSSFFTDLQPENYNLSNNIRFTTTTALCEIATAESDYMKDKIAEEIGRSFD